MGTNFSTTITVDTSNFKVFAANCRKVYPLAAKQLVTDLKTGGSITALKAKDLSGWSDRIPKTIRVKPLGAAVEVTAGGAQAPHARPFEHRGRPGEFRHPVFGNEDVLVDQRARPFLAPALRLTEPKIVHTAADGLEEAMRAAGVIA